MIDSENGALSGLESECRISNESDHVSDHVSDCGCDRDNDDDSET